MALPRQMQMSAASLVSSSSRPAMTAPSVLSTACHGPRRCSALVSEISTRTHRLEVDSGADGDLFGLVEQLGGDRRLLRHLQPHLNVRLGLVEGDQAFVVAAADAVDEVDVVLREGLGAAGGFDDLHRSEEHTSELQ